MIYDTYNGQSSNPNQSIQGRSNSLYIKEDVPVLPRRYHDKLRDGDETKNKKRLYPEKDFPDLYDKDKEDGKEDSDTGTFSINPDDNNEDLNTGMNINSMNGDENTK